MRKKLLVMAMMILLAGQTVVGPLATISAYANNTDELVTSVDAVTQETTPPTEVEQPELEIEQQPNDPENNQSSEGNPEQQQAPPVEEGKDEGKVDTVLSKDVLEESEVQDLGPVKEEQKVPEEQPQEGEDAGEVNKTLAPASGNKTGFHLVLDKATQGPNDEPFNETNPLNPMNEFFVHYKWSLDDGHGYDAGDTVSFNLPKQLNILANANGELADANGTVFANYYVATNGKVTFTFTEAVDNMSAIEGDFYIKSRLNPSQTEIEDGKVIIGPMAEGESLKIPVNTGEMAANISKAGTPLPAFSPKEVEWTITVDSKMVKHKDGKVTDLLPSGLTFKPGTVKINGQESVDPTIDGKNLSFNLGDFSGTKTITFITTIDKENWSDKAFYNKATYEADKVSPIEAGASVTINRGNPLVKKPGSYDSKTRTITWTIEMNYDSQDLVNTKLVDTWDTGSMDFVEGSVVVSEMKLDEGGNASLVGVSDIPKTVTSSANGITIDFPKVDKPYKITYQTKLKERPTENSKIKNNVSWNGHTSGNEVSVPQGVLTKHVGAPNYKDKTVKWWFKANSDRQELKNIVLSDKFATPGLTMKENSLVVKVGNKVISADNYTVQYNVQGQAFVLTFNPEFKTNQEIIVEFETYFDYAALKAANQTEFKNTGKITSTDYEGNKHKDREAYQVLPMDDFTKHDGNKSGYYDARDKTITWTIGVNYQQNAHEELIVKDFIQGNQKLLPDTIKVSEGVLGGGNNSIWAGAEIADANVTKPEIDGKPGFSVNLGKTNKPYVITYKTSLAGLDYIETNYKNTANVFDGTTKLTDLPADVGITLGGKYGGKTGKQNGKAIDWTVTVNASQAKVQDVVLTDTLSANQEFLRDTIKVYATTVDNFGNVTKGAAYDNVTINVTEEAPQTLTVKFNETIDRPYIVEYSTLYFAGHNEIVSNDYKVTGSNIGDKGQQGGTANVKIDQSTGGSGSGKVGYLQVHKVASDDESKVFAGIEFQLIDEKTGKVLKTGVTDKDGNIDFGRLMFGNYLLKETKAPEGYITPTEAYKVTINKEYVKGDTEKIGNIQTIVNEKEIKQIEIGKYEPGASWLAGAEFMIKNDKGEVVEENLVTDANGKVTSKELPVGTYTLVETKAPQGYNKVTEPIEFTIEAGKAEPVVRDVPNVKLGDVLLEKIDKKTKEKLVGVEFELQKKNAETGKFEKIGATLTTDEHGVITVKDLEDGEYQFVETKPLEGYKPLKEPITFTVAQKTRAALNFVVENEIDESSQKVIKVDADDETKRLAGAQFELYAEKDGERTLIPNGDKTYFTTDTNGEIEFTQLDDGKYVFKEIKSPTGYEITQVEYNFKVGDGKVEPITVTNKMKLVTIELVKKDIATGNPLAGVVFTLTNQDGSVKFENLDTDAEGKLTIENVPEGQYTLTETKRPEGYQSLPKPIVINVTHDAKALIEVEVPNAPLGHAQIMKVETGTINPIAGVTFNLEKYEDGTWKEISQVTTSELGLAFSDKLDFGQYRYVEVEAPAGVVIENTPVEFEVNQKHYDKEDLSFTAENSYKNPVAELLKVDDKNNVLAGAQFELYKVMRTGEDELIPNGDQTYFTTDENGKIIVELAEAGDYYFIETKAPAGYKLDKKPQPFTVGKGQVAEVKMTNEKLPIIITKGAVELTKVDTKDSSKVLAGAEFKLVDKAGNIVKENLVTGADGKIKVNGLDAGDYYFVETKAPKGYELDTSKQLVQATNNTVATVTMNNTQTPAGPPTPPDPQESKGAVELLKVDAKDSSNVLAGAEFKLVDKAGITVKENLVTDTDGKIKVDGLDVGDYYFVETKAPEGYELDTSKQLVQVAQNTTAKVMMENVKQPVEPTPPLKGDVELTKVDAKDSSNVLAGAEFKLVDKAGITVKENLVTDADGKIKVDGLDVGDYYFVETKAPAGYELNTTKHLVQVEADAQATISITNSKKPTGGGGGSEPKEASVKLVKVDSETNAVLQGAIFELYHVVAGQDQKVGTYVTDRSGEIYINALPPGDYYFKEIKAPIGYQQSAQTTSLTLSRGDTALVTVENSKLPTTPTEPEENKAQLTLVKVAEDSQLLLAGATFELFRLTAIGGEKIGSYTTNERGEIIINNLPIGDYYFVETKAPIGYVLSTEKIAVQLDKTMQVIVKNKKEPTPDPGGNGETPTPDPGGNGETPTPNPGGNGEVPTPTPGDNNETPKPTPVNPPTQVEKPNQGSGTGEGHVLPQTDGKGSSVYQIIGGVLLMAAIAFLIARRKKVV